MVSTPVECAKYPGEPLFRLSEEMSWGIHFSRQDIAELEKFLEIMGPLEKLFSSLDSEKSSTIQKVYPSIKVKMMSLYFKFIVC